MMVMYEKSDLRWFLQKICILKGVMVSTLIRELQHLNR